MPLTDQEIKQIQDQIALAATAAAPVAALLGPEAVAALIIGRAVAGQMPQLVAIVQRWIAGQAPTEDEKAMVRAELAVLGDPNLP